MYESVYELSFGIINSPPAGDLSFRNQVPLIDGRLSPGPIGRSSPATIFLRSQTRAPSPRCPYVSSNHRGGSGVREEQGLAVMTRWAGLGDAHSDLPAPLIPVRTKSNGLSVMDHRNGSRSGCVINDSEACFIPCQNHSHVTQLSPNPSRLGSVLI
ncbi:hypothetical protein TNCV_816041 [Trichonephila clavipes]|nr:hypothetical protein TNCV_816041 [Trichonephila clavipes]